MRKGGARPNPTRIVPFYSGYLTIVISKLTAFKTFSKLWQCRRELGAPSDMIGNELTAEDAGGSFHFTAENSRRNFKTHAVNFKSHAVKWNDPYMVSVSWRAKRMRSRRPTDCDHTGGSGCHWPGRGTCAHSAHKEGDADRSNVLATPSIATSVEGLPRSACD